MVLVFASSNFLAGSLFALWCIVAEKVFGSVHGAEANRAHESAHEQGTKHGGCSRPPGGYAEQPLLWSIKVGCIPGIRTFRCCIHCREILRTRFSSVASQEQSNPLYAHGPDKENLLLRKPCLLPIITIMETHVPYGLAHASDGHEIFGCVAFWTQALNELRQPYIFDEEYQQLQQRRQDVNSKRRYVR